MRDGVFPSGSRLPGERELAERFGVSRVAIREAEIALQAMGKVRIKTGSGVYVVEEADRVRDELPQVSAFELTEARSLFESQAAALAAPVISEELLAKLEDLLKVMADDENSDGARPEEADRDFHLTIASASGNRAVLHVIKVLWRLRMELPDVRSTHDAVCRHNGKKRQAEHAAIVKALRKRDPQAARLAMRQHFNRLIEAMLDATEQRQMSELRLKAAESRARYRISAQLD